MNRQKTLDYILKVAWQTVANRYNQIASRHGITQATGYVLINIHQEGVPVTQMASLLGVKSTSLSRLLSGLETQGLIYRAADKVDKRSVRVFLTPEGVKKREKAKDVVREFNRYLDDNISEEDRAFAIATLRKITDLAAVYKPNGSTDDLL